MENKNGGVQDNALRNDVAALRNEVADLKTQMEIYKEVQQNHIKDIKDLQDDQKQLSAKIPENIEQLQGYIETLQDDLDDDTIKKLKDLPEHIEKLQKNLDDDTIKKLKALLNDKNDLDEDAFVMMTICSPCSPQNKKCWLLGIFCFAVQVLLGVLIAKDQLTLKFGSSRANIPIAVTAFVRIGQGIAIALALMMQSDVLASIKMISLYCRTKVTTCQGNDWKVTWNSGGTKIAWQIVLPNIMKLLEGCLMLGLSMIVIIQSSDLLDMFKDFTALNVISSIDNAFFRLAHENYLGTDLKEAAKQLKKQRKLASNHSCQNTSTPASGQSQTSSPASGQSQTPTPAPEHSQTSTPASGQSQTSTPASGQSQTTCGSRGWWPIEQISITVMVVLVLLCMYLFWGLWVVNGQNSGRFARQKYPLCNQTLLPKLGDGVCNGGLYNTLDCGYDDGDCSELNERYPECDADDPTKLGDSHCDMGKYFTRQCGYDLGDCDCGHDGEQDCKQHKECKAENHLLLYNNICNGGLYNTPECNFDGGDCDTYNQYPKCDVPEPWRIGDGICDDYPYDSLNCGYDAGDCLKIGFEERYPNCEVLFPDAVGDGKCDNDKNYNNADCKWDGNDCIFPAYPNCHVNKISRINDGYCDGGIYNTEECAYDGGDCLAFRERYPDCKVDYPARINDTKCDGDIYNTEECGYDGGDCLSKDWPDCRVQFIHFLGDETCHGGDYNTSECGYDGGDCLTWP